MIAPVPIQTYSLLDMPMGTAVLIVGIMALLLWAAVTFRNPLAVTVWAFSVILFILSGLFGIGFELVWISTIGTVILLVIGLIARWMQ